MTNARIEELKAKRAGIDAEIMALEGHSLIAVILDRSGSMASIQVEMQMALNKLVADQKAVPGECMFTLCQFDDLIETPHDQEDLQKIPHLRLKPRGSTALLDAMGQTLTRIRYTPAKSRVAVVITDGMENASREWSRDKVFHLVTDMRKEGWEFTFLGANQDAIAVGTSLGIQGRAVMDFAATGAGVANASASMSDAIANTRTTGESVNYSQVDREAAMEGGTAAGGSGS